MRNTFNKVPEWDREERRVVDPKHKRELLEGLHATRTALEQLLPALAQARVRTTPHRICKLLGPVHIEASELHQALERLNTALQAEP
jgi:hypothetical protein